MSKKWFTTPQFVHNIQYFSTQLPQLSTHILFKSGETLTIQTEIIYLILINLDNTYSLTYS